MYHNQLECHLTVFCIDLIVVYFVKLARKHWPVNKPLLLRHFPKFLEISVLTSKITFVNVVIFQPGFANISTRRITTKCGSQDYQDRLKYLQKEEMSTIVQRCSRKLEGNQMILTYGAWKCYFRNNFNPLYSRFLEIISCIFWLRSPYSSRSERRMGSNWNPLRWHEHNVSTHFIKLLRFSKVWWRRLVLTPIQIKGKTRALLFS